MRNKITWAVLLVLYLSFFSWYTSFGGPLSDEEVEHFFALVTQRNPDMSDERRAMFRDFLESDTGDDFVMVNVIDLHDTPIAVEGVEPGETSSEVLGKYMEFMFPELLSRACHPVLYGQAAAPALEMFGIDGVRIWDQGAGMRYRSRRDMLEITSNPAFQGSHDFKIAAINKTFAFPIDPWYQLGDPRLILALLFTTIGFAVSSIRSGS
jgi:hypothetical protein